MIKYRREKSILYETKIHESTFNDVIFNQINTHSRQNYPLPIPVFIEFAKPNLNVKRNIHLL